MSDDIAARLQAVQERIHAACKRAGRDPAHVTLVAVSKTRTVDECREAVRAGQAVLGENYAQELRDKAAQLPDAWWHFVGPLQRNKVKYVVGTAQLIHSLDTPALADELAARATKLTLSQHVLLQVNIGREPQKSGCLPNDLPSLLDHVRSLPSLSCDGLMCIPPAGEDPVPHFRALKALADEHRLPQLSMGMSGDFEPAIAEGATLVRIGTAIFGERRKKT